MIASRFEHQLAVVTGANSGIGRATAIRLLREGARLVAVDLEHTEAWPEDLVSRLEVVSADVTAPEAADLVAAAVDAQDYPVSVLVNAAGILRFAPFLETTREQWDRVLSVNLTSVFFLSQAIARRMVAAGTPGRIVNVSSVHAVVSEPLAAPYTAAKGGMEAMTRTIATELAPYGITANCVRPGATDTNMSRPIYTPLILEALAQRIPLREIAPPEWVASAICYLASAEARYTTGACLDVDGGYAMNGSLPGASYA